MTAAGPGVIIVGAGPTGLMLAAELALAGVACEVLDRLPGPRTDSRACCLHARSLETLDLRGLAGRFAAAGQPVPAFPLGPRGAELDFTRLDSDFGYLLDIPQSQIERLLAARAAELGVTIRWSAEVTALRQDAAGVGVSVAAGPARGRGSCGPDTWPAATGCAASCAAHWACRSPERPIPAR